MKNNKKEMDRLQFSAMLSPDKVTHREPDASPQQKGASQKTTEKQ
jgi:hypothetical protein